MITMIDNYDSFTYNLVQQIERLSGERLEVIRNDAFDVDALLESNPDAIVVSPGPGRPENAGRIVELIRRNERTPLLGVCLGHQAIGEAFGAQVTRGAEPVHGKISEITHDSERLFAGCDATMHIARYHSLVIDKATLPRELVVDATTRDGVVMAISHTERPTFGVQFHPESYGTIGGDRVIENFLAIAGLRVGTLRERPVPVESSQPTSEYRTHSVSPYPSPTGDTEPES